jgi:hypothetical protein
MTFAEILAQVIDLLQHQGRVSNCLPLASGGS